MSESLCSRCVALCCRYFALPIDNPDSVSDYDNIRWYLAHENVVIFVEDKQWYIGILNKCKHLLPDHRCEIYETRPRICRGYSTKNCDYHGDEYQFDLLFTSAEQLRVYAEETLSRKRKRKVRLPVGDRPRRVLRMPPMNGNGHASGNGKQNGSGNANANANGNGNGNGHVGSKNGKPAAGRVNGIALPILLAR